jgi:2-hydroxychromene-2-carboxylate isomerase
VYDPRPPSPTEFFFDYASPFTYIGAPLPLPCASMRCGVLTSSVASVRIERYFGENNVQWRPFVLGGLFKKLEGPVRSTCMIDFRHSNSDYVPIRMSRTFR